MIHDFCGSLRNNNLFLDFPRNKRIYVYIYIQNSMVDLRSSRSPMQLALEYAHNCKKNGQKSKTLKYNALRICKIQRTKA